MYIFQIDAITEEITADTYQEAQAEMVRRHPGVDLLLVSVTV